MEAAFIAQAGMAVALVGAILLAFAGWERWRDHQ